MVELLQNSKAGYSEVVETGKETRWEKTKTDGSYVLRVYLWLFALASASALLTPKDILTSHPVLRDSFIGFSYTVSFLFKSSAVDEFAALSHFNEVALFTVAILNIASILLFFFYPCPPSRRWLIGPLGQSYLMTTIMGYILSSKMMLDFYNGFLQKGYVSNEVAGFMFDSRMGLALSAILFMTIAPILVIALRFLMPPSANRRSYENSRMSFFGSEQPSVLTKASVMNAYRNLKAQLSKLSFTDFGCMALLAVFIYLDDDFSLPTALIVGILIMYNWADYKDKKLDYSFPRAYGWYFELSLVVALFVPKDILSSCPILKDYFVDPVSSLVAFWLPIHEFAEMSDFPEVTLFVFSLLVALFPVVTAIYVHALSKKDRAFHYGLILPDAPRGNKILVNLMWIYLMTLGMFLYFPEIMVSLHGLPDRVGIVDKAFTSMFVSRIGLGSVAPIIMIVSSLFLGEFIIMHKEGFSNALKSLKTAGSINLE
ncbi:MAG: hypothetical protein LBL72_07745 [Candidatus Accumulibacter sp.]|jgi:hypothetical protein|nr:hypothetical protein [Accumulibacter sp.]